MTAQSSKRLEAPKSYDFSENSEYCVLRILQINFYTGNWSVNNIKHDKSQGLTKKQTSVHPYYKKTNSSISAAYSLLGPGNGKIGNGLRME